MNIKLPIDIPIMNYLVLKMQMIEQAYRAVPMWQLEKQKIDRQKIVSQYLKAVKVVPTFANFTT